MMSAPWARGCHTPLPEVDRDCARYLKKIKGADRGFAGSLKKIDAGMDGCIGHAIEDGHSVAANVQGQVPLRVDQTRRRLCPEHNLLEAQLYQRTLSCSVKFANKFCGERAADYPGVFLRVPDQYVYSDVRHGRPDVF